jgi:hypothetical protein
MLVADEPGMILHDRGRCRISYQASAASQSSPSARDPNDWNLRREMSETRLTAARWAAESLTAAPGAYPCVSRYNRGMIVV